MLLKVKTEATTTVSLLFLIYILTEQNAQKSIYFLCFIAYQSAFGCGFALWNMDSKCISLTNYQKLCEENITHLNVSVCFAFSPNSVCVCAHNMTTNPS